MIEDVIERWHAHLRGDVADGLDELLDDDVVFYSPVVHTPQHGKELTAMYLTAAAQALPGDGAEDIGAGPLGPDDGSAEDPTRFRYTKQVMSGDTAVLEFETTVEGIHINGVDIIRCNDQGRIVEFRVMLRPLKAINLVHAQMKAMLESMAPPSA
jgi:hypothetical protein